MDGLNIDFNNVMQSNKLNKIKSIYTSHLEITLFHRYQSYSKYDDIQILIKVTSSSGWGKVSTEVVNFIVGSNFHLKLSLILHYAF